MAALELPKAFEDKGTRPTTDASDDSLEADERSGAVTAVHHEVFDLALALDVTGEDLGYRGASESW